MINRILMELYDDYSENQIIDDLIGFAQKTFPSDGTDKLFIGCVLILFSIAGGYKPRYYCSKENLEAIVILAKEKIGPTNLLAFYIERVNQTKGINKYLEKVVNDSNLDKYADLIIEYLSQFKLDLVGEIKNHRSINKYISKGCTSLSYTLNFIVTRL
jgi:hypothetical protein